MAASTDPAARRSTAEYLLAFRKELTVGGLDDDTVDELLFIAAKITIGNDGLGVREAETDHG